MRLSLVASSALTFVGLAQAIDHFPFPCHETYQVAQGDSCDSIATAAGTTAALLQLWNQDFATNFDCASVTPGQLLCVDYTLSIAKRDVSEEPIKSSPHVDISKKPHAKKGKKHHGKKHTKSAAPAVVSKRSVAHKKAPHHPKKAPHHPKKAPHHPKKPTAPHTKKPVVPAVPHAKRAASGAPAPVVPAPVVPKIAGGKHHPKKAGHKKHHKKAAHAKKHHKKAHHSKKAPTTTKA